MNRDRVIQNEVDVGQDEAVEGKAQGNNCCYFRD
jgi:hypothetical protein